MASFLSLNQHRMYHFTKKITWLAWVLLLCCKAWAQPAYPTAPTLPNITHGEYFIATDPGAGNGTPIELTAGTNIPSLVTTANIASLPTGVYSVGLRTRNADGVWSHATLGVFFKIDLPAYPATGTAGTMAGAEYFLNTDPGLGMAQALSLPTQTNISNAAALIDLSTIPVGFHVLGIRSRNAQGLWGHTTLATLVKIDLPAYPTTSTLPAITAAEYFVGTDPGPGNATPLPLVPASNIANAGFVLSIPATPAIYTLGIRTRDANGNWSQTNLRLYDNLTAATYPAPPASPANLQQLEYFIDNDPGFGLATAIPITAATDMQNLNVSINLAGLAEGQHSLFIRSRSNPWSHTTIAEFTLGSVLPLRWSYIRGNIQATSAYIDWGTLAETATRDFWVEHSTDGIRYNKVATVAASGNSQSGRSYQYIHTNPAPGINYYRIRQNDIDGAFTYSKTITLLQRNGLKQAVLAPNPVTNQLRLLLPQPLSQAGELRVVDMKGKVVLRQPIASGTTLAGMACSQLAAGSYQLIIQAGTYIETLPMVKQ
jgi:hypothetical protein